jgi:hypothetical protein
MGYIEDRTGGYDNGLFLVGGALIVGGLLGFALARKGSAPSGVRAA